MTRAEQITQLQSQVPCPVCGLNSPLSAHECVLTRRDRQVRQALAADFCANHGHVYETSEICVVCGHSRGKLASELFDEIKGFQVKHAREPASLHVGPADLEHLRGELLDAGRVSFGSGHYGGRGADLPATFGGVPLVEDPNLPAGQAVAMSAEPVPYFRDVGVSFADVKVAAASARDGFDALRMQFRNVSPHSHIKLSP